jgi:DNA-binding response OmpR family regulator
MRLNFLRVPAEETIGMKLRVLIVDSDKGACESIQAAMAASNLETILETSSSRAAEFLRKEKYDAMFLELQMPTPDGVQLAKLARGSGINRRTPIIMLSGQNAPDAMSKAFEAGANFFLFKPFDRSRLMRVWRAAHGPIEQERRRFHRVEVQLPVVVELSDAKMEGKTVDLSQQGMLVETPKTFPVGSQVRFRLALGSGQKAITGAAKVMRQAGATKMGMEIEAMSGDDASRLQTFLLPLILKSVGEGDA